MDPVRPRCHSDIHTVVDQQAGADLVGYRHKM
jgi:hypothetical protein